MSELSKQLFYSQWTPKKVLARAVLETNPSKKTLKKLKQENIVTHEDIESANNAKRNSEYIIDTAKRTGYPIDEIPFPNSKVSVEPYYVFGNDTIYRPEYTTHPLYGPINYKRREYKNEQLFPKTDKLVEPSAYFSSERERINERYAIPFIKDKKESWHGYIYSTNLLDSIANHAEQHNVPLKEALTPFVHESKLGHFPYTLIRNYKDYNKFMKKEYGTQSTFEALGKTTPMEAAHAGYLTVSPTLNDLSYGLSNTIETYSPAYFNYNYKNEKKFN